MSDNNHEKVGRVAGVGVGRVGPIQEEQKFWFVSIALLDDPGNGFVDQIRTIGKSELDKAVRFAVQKNLQIGPEPELDTVAVDVADRPDVDVGFGSFELGFGSVEHERRHGRNRGQKEESPPPSTGR